MSWYERARSHASLGSSAPRPGSLAGLAARRRETLSQFFTPSEVAGLLWRIASPAMESALARDPGAKVALLDTSVGSGRLFQFAQPAHHLLAGADVHGPSIDVLTEDAEAAGFEVDLLHAGMETLRPKGFGVALLNPPFSQHLDAPTVMPLPGNAYGVFGPASAAVSHRYAVEQALTACDMVLSILPRSAAAAWLDDPDCHDRLRAVLSLPSGSFREEGTEVDVDLVVFGPEDEPARPIEMQLASLDDPIPDLKLACRNTWERQPKPLSAVTIGASTPSITLPVTSDNTVRLNHNGRHLVLGFEDGLTQAKVQNGLLRRPVRPPGEKHRYPKGVQFAGQGLFDLEIYLLQEDPQACFDGLLARIRELGGNPVVSGTMKGYFSRRLRQHARESTPFRHVVRGADPSLAARGAFKATATKLRLMDPGKWGTGVIRQGQSCDVEVIDGAFVVTHPDTAETIALGEVDFLAGFEVEDGLPGTDDWTVVHEGRVAAFPQLAGAIRSDIERAGMLAWLDRDYQVHDLIEMRMSRGAVLAWVMALGKTRAALALSLLGGQHSLIVLEPQLIDECRDEISKIGLPDGLWQVITRPEHCQSLRKINIISYTRLRMPVASGAGRRTYARLLRRRIGTMVADEGDVLTNHGSQQSRAIAMVSPRRRYLMTGTPVRNMPRDILGVTTYAGGDGSAVQPFGRHHPYLSPVLAKSMDVATTGARQFAEDHSVFEWVTHEFVDSGLVAGAKREVPKVRNIGRLRSFAAPLLKRRIQEEPEVARYIQIPEAEKVVTTLPWDEGHLSHYLMLADEFADWYREARKRATGRGTGVNLISILARVGVVQRAVTCPQFPAPGFGAYLPLTSKQRYLIDRMETLAAAGRKLLCYVEQPMMVDLLVRQLGDRGVEAVPFHGGIPIMARVKDMNRRFRHGDAPIMIATKETCQSGYNIPQANYVLFGDRSWVARTEEQAMYRVLRGEQTRNVEAEYVHLAGSADEYQAQVVAMKQDTIGATIDFLTPELQEAQFLHMDAILETFIADLAERRGFDRPHAFREALKHAA